MTKMIRMVRIKRGDERFCTRFKKCAWAAPEVPSPEFAAETFG